MNMKRTFLSIGLAVGLLVMLLLPLFMWQGPDEAHAQDVGVATVSDLTIAFTTGLEIEFDEQGSIFIELKDTNSTTPSTTIANAEFVVKYPNDLVRLVDVKHADSLGKVNILDKDTDGTVNFNIIFNNSAFSPTLTATNIVEMKWQCLGIGVANLEFLKANVDVVGPMMTDGAPGTLTNGEVKCTRPDMAIWINPEDERTVDIGNTVQSTVLVTDATELGRIDWGVVFNTNVVKPVKVEPRGLLAGTNPTWQVQGNVLKFQSGSVDVDGRRDGSIALITWEAIGEGVSEQDFDASETQFFDMSNAEISGEPVTQKDGGLINVNPAKVKILLINNDDATTDNASVTLTYNLPDGSWASIKFWNEGEAEPQDWETLKDKRINWPLGKGAAGTRTVNMRLLGTNGKTTSDVFQDDINLTTDNSSAPTPTITPTVVPTGTTPTPTITPTVDPTTPTVTPTPNPSGNITGRVRLQGNATQGDYKVHAENVPCNLFTPSSSNQVNATITANGTTDGTFTLANNGYLCLQIVRDNYLSAQRSNPSGDLGFIELKGGDFNGDNKINILDLSVAGAAFGKSNGKVDFNGDGKVDILDLSIVAGNYNRTGPTTNWSN